MAGGSAIRGSRVGLVRWARPSGATPRRGITSRTSAHTVMRRGRHLLQMPRFPTPGTGPRCGLPANLDSRNPPPPPKIEPYKTHLAYVKERRTDKEAADILTEALQALRARRERGEVIY